jgi:hypothetical protein
MSIKTSSKAIGIKPHTFQLAAQCRSQLRNRASSIKVKAENISVTEVSSSQGAQSLDHILLKHDAVHSGQ